MVGSLDVSSISAPFLWRTQSCLVAWQVGPRLGFTPADPWPRLLSDHTTQSCSLAAPVGGGMDER